MSVQELLAEYRSSSALVDTNMLLVYLTGLVSPGAVGKTRKTKAYTELDFRALDTILGAFEARITFPNVLTEVSNLLEKAETEFKFRLFEKLKQIAGEFIEQYNPTVNLDLTKYPHILGVTDEVLLSAVGSDFVLLSDDFDLTNRYQAEGGRILNFNHIREAYL